MNLLVRKFFLVIIQDDLFCVQFPRNKTVDIKTQQLCFFFMYININGLTKTLVKTYFFGWIYCIGIIDVLRRRASGGEDA